jgi:tetratricopeptide (TPR) repeat protein
MLQKKIRIEKARQLLTITGLLGGLTLATQTLAASRCEDSLQQKSISETIEVCREELTAPVSREKRVLILMALGRAYAEQGETELAINTWKEGAQYLAPSEDNPIATEHWAMLQVFIAQAYQQSNQLDKARQQLLETAARIDQTVGRHATAAGLVQNALGDFYAQSNQAQASEEAFTRARIIYELHFGKLHPKTLEVRMNYAVALLDMGKEDQAMPYFQVLLALIEQHPELNREPVKAEVLIYMGTLEMRHEQLQAAAKHYQAAYEVRLAVFGAKDLRTSQALNNLGVVLYRAGDLAKAEQALSKAYVIRLEALGDNDALTISSKKNLQAVIAAQKGK